MKRWLILIPFLLIFHIVSAQESENPLEWLRLNTLDGWQVFAELAAVCSVDANDQSECTTPVRRSMPQIAIGDALPTERRLRLTLGDMALREPLQLSLLDAGDVVATESFVPVANSEIEWQPDVLAGEYTLSIEVHPTDAPLQTFFVVQYFIQILTPAELEDFFASPPPLFLNTTDSLWTEGLHGGYCFPPTEAMDCISVYAMPLPEDYLTVPDGDTIHLRLGTLPYPESVSLALFSRTSSDDAITLRTDYDLTGEPIEFTWTPDVEPNDYVLMVHMQWSDTSSVDYVFGVTLAEPIVTVSEPPQFSLWTADNIIVGGQQGSYCWDDGTGHICRDFMFDTPEVYHSLLEGNVFYIVVQSNNAPDKVFVSFFTPDMESVLSSVELSAPEPGIFMRIIEDLPDGDYIAIVMGIWAEGDASNIFGIHVGQ
jgi:hypothetical protein